MTMIRIILLTILFAGTAVIGDAADSCTDCHGNRQQMEAQGYGHFTVTAQEAADQTRMPAGCSECHLGDPAAKQKDKDHTGLARLIVVAKKGFIASTSARQHPTSLA